MSEIVVITDTSVLVNFLVIDRTDLLSRLPNHRFVVTDHVRAEVTEIYPDQLRRLEAAFDAGTMEEIRVTDLQEVQLFAQLTAIGLGTGECSAIAVAAHRRLALAIDDKRVLKKNPERRLRSGYSFHRVDCRASPPTFSTDSRRSGCTETGMGTESSFPIRLYQLHPATRNNLM